MNTKKTIITICGDLCPTKDTEVYFKAENHEKLFNNCLSLFQSSDLLIGNLEFPLIENAGEISKTGPLLRGDDNFISIFKKAGFDVLSLANNHIKDFGELGVKNTLELCKKNNIATIGAGKNIGEAKIPLIKEKNGWKIGLMAFAEQEFNCASEKEYGANFLDVYEDFEAIKEFKKQVDFLIIQYHGGIEYYEYPSPLLQKKCRKMITSGADLVTCQHSHCIGSEEKYIEGNIIYGQGNTLFGYREGKQSWNEGLLLQITLSEQEKVKLNYIPISAVHIGIEMMDEKNAAACLHKFQDNSKEIQDKEFIQSSWERFCERKKSLYLPLFFGFNRILIHLNRQLRNKLVKLLYSKRKIQTAKNIIRCESHKEVLDTIFINETK